MAPRALFDTPDVGNYSITSLIRSSMTNERLDSLALGYINHERSPFPEEVLQVWDGSGHRRIAIPFQSDDC